MREVQRIMGKHPKLDGLLRKMREGKDFEISRSQYKKLTGIDIPQDKKYTEKRSSISKKANDEGFDIEVIEERLVFRKRRNVK